MIWNEIVCLGDSITFGARDEYGRCYPAELGSVELNQDSTDALAEFTATIRYTYHITV